MKKLLLMFVLTVLCGSAWALSFNMKTRYMREPGQPVQTCRVVVADRKVRMDVEPAGQATPESSFLFDAEAQRLRILDHGRQSYSDLHRKDLETMGATLSAVQKQMEQIPEQQRKFLEQMMGKSLPSAQPAGQDKDRERLQKLDKEREIEGVVCRRSVLDLGEGRRMELWVAPWDALPDGATAADALSALAAFLEPARQFIEDSVGGEADILSHVETMDGFPLAVREIDGNGARMITLVSDLADAPPGEDAFETPSDYRRRSIPITNLNGLTLP